LKQSPALPAIPPTAWSKQRPLNAALLEVARALGPDQQLPTVRQLCARFGVSTSTLDIALRELTLRGAIMRAHGRGIFTSPTIHQQTIGVVFGGDIFSPCFSPFWGLLLQAVRAQAWAYDLRLLAYLDISEGQAEVGGHTQLFEDLQAQRLDGLLLLSPYNTPDEASQLQASGIPLVVFGSTSQGWKVTHDTTQFLHIAARALAARGCRRVALLGHGVLGYRPLLEDTLRAAGARDVQVADWSYETWAGQIPGAGTHENLAYRLTQRMIADAECRPLPDGVVSLDDTMTHGALVALQHAGVRPNRDLYLATSVNTGSPVLDLYAEELICLAFDPAHSVCAALEMLTTLMNGGTPPLNPVLIAPALKGDHP
jgi:DNA-binding LacI/PurR family transcriptional regulator